jgi:hypothetical protein
MTSRRGLKVSLAVGLGLGLAACSNPTGLELIPEAVVSCPEYGSLPPDQVMPQANMLPGAVCGACHRTGGQAQNSPWTLSGTIFPAAMTSMCGGNSLPMQLAIDVLYGEDDPNGTYRANMVQPNGTLVTNSVGNFYTAAKFVAPIAIRLYDPANPTHQTLMQTLVGQDPNTGATTRVDCNFCHYPGSPNLPGNTYGRIYLP